MKFSVKDLFSKCDHLQFPADFGKFTEEILNGKLLFCAVFALKNKLNFMIL